MSKEVMRQALEKIATVNAMDYEYQAWAREALAEQPAQRGPLTETEIRTLRCDLAGTLDVQYVTFARAIEAAHGIREKK